MVNESRMVVCDLGNPMVAGTEVSCDTRKHKHTGAVAINRCVIIYIGDLSSVVPSLIL